ncbi:MAG: hypothetical protein AAGC47_02530 [Bacteroidota bacterium]
MKESLYKLGFFLTKTNLFISAAASLSVLNGFYYFSLPPNFALVGFVFFATLFTYNIQRVLGDLKNTSKSTGYSKLFMAVGLLGVGLLTWKIDCVQIIILSFCGLLSIAYSFPFLPSKEGRLSLRLVPRMKILVIVLVWSFSIAYVPIYDAGLSTAQLSLYTLQQAFFIAALTIPFDIRDLQFDSPNQQTLPQWLGISKSVSLAKIFLIFSFSCSLIMYLSGSIASVILLGTAISMTISAVIVNRARPKNDDLYFTILIDGLIILQAVLIILVEYYF